MTLRGLCVEITILEVGLFILIAQSGASQALYVFDQVNIIYNNNIGMDYQMKMTDALIEHNKKEKI